MKLHIAVGGGEGENCINNDDVSSEKPNETFSAKERKKEMKAINTNVKNNAFSNPKK